MIAQSKIKPNQELFTAYLGSYEDKNDPDKGQSFYTFGFIDEDVVKATGSNIWYTHVDDSNGFWQFSSTSNSINGHVHHLPGGSAIADTGTTLALIDDATCKLIYAAIPDSKFSKAMGVSIPAYTLHRLNLVLIMVCRATFSQPRLRRLRCQMSSSTSAARCLG